MLMLIRVNITQLFNVGLEISLTQSWMLADFNFIFQYRVNFFLKNSGDLNCFL